MKRLRFKKAPRIGRPIVAGAVRARLAPNEREIRVSKSRRADVIRGLKNKGYTVLGTSHEPFSSMVTIWFY